MLNSPKSAIPTNSLIKGKYKLVKKIGQGAFGEIYSGKAIGTTGNELVAIKFEKVDVKKQVLKLEVAILRKLQESCAYVARFITCGRINDYNYMVMELLGENISELRRRQPLGKFTMPTTLRLGIQMITILESIHDMGYVHRDVKPSNFVLGLGSKKSNIYVIDFGLARRFVGPDGDVRPVSLYDSIIIITNVKIDSEIYLLTTIFFLDCLNRHVIKRVFVEQHDMRR
jgi:tau tubulin kinase